MFTDASGRVVRSVSVRAGFGYEVLTGYTANGTRGSLSVQKRNESNQSLVWGPYELTFDYDTLLRVKSLPDFAGKVTSVTYNRDDQPNAITLPTGNNSAQRLQATYSYNAAHSLTQVAYNQGLDATIGRMFNRDALQRVYSRTRGPWDDQYGRSFGYDDLGRLTSYSDSHYWVEHQWVCNDPMQFYCPDDGYWNDIPHTDPIRSGSYTYDAVGNRTDRPHSLQTGNRMTSFDGWTITYDSVGNVKTKANGGTSYTYKWDDLGQLDTVIVNGVTSTYGYDGFGRRVRKTVNGTTTQYIYDGDNLVAELDGSGNLLREYSYYPGIDRPHAMRQQSNGAVYYYTTQEAGHVSALVNTTNSVVNSYELDPFGNSVSSSETLTQPFRFGGREYDSETGLYYLRARYYDPQLARFLSEDPIGLGGGINVYTYTGGDPVNSRDPDGLNYCSIAQLEEGYTNDTADDGKGWCVPPATLAPVVVTAQPPQGPGDPPPLPPIAPSWPEPAEGETGAGPADPGNPATRQQQTCHLTALQWQAARDALRRSARAGVERVTVAVRDGTTVRLVHPRITASDSQSVTWVAPPNALWDAHGHLRFGPNDHNYGSLSESDTTGATHRVIALSVDSVSIYDPGPAARITTCHR